MPAILKRNLHKTIAKYAAKRQRSLRKWFGKKTNQRKAHYAVGIGIILVLVVGLIISQVQSHNHAIMYQSQQKAWHTQRAKLTEQLKAVEAQKASTEAEVKAKAQKEADLQNQINDLNSQLQAKRAAQATLASRVINSVTQTQKVYAAPATGGCGTGDSALDFIIQKESGCNPHAVNASSGACGLGQSLPCSKVLSACGSLDNVACQVEWVRNYCIGRYGSTAAAYSFWQANHWY